MRAANRVIAAGGELPLIGGGSPGQRRGPHVQSLMEMAAEIDGQSTSGSEGGRDGEPGKMCEGEVENHTRWQAWLNKDVSEALTEVGDGGEEAKAAAEGLLSTHGITKIGQLETLREEDLTDAMREANTPMGARALLSERRRTRRSRLS